MDTVKRCPIVKSTTKRRLHVMLSFGNDFMIHRSAHPPSFAKIVMIVILSIVVAYALTVTIPTIDAKTTWNVKKELASTNDAAKNSNTVTVRANAIPLVILDRYVKNAQRLMVCRHAMVMEHALQSTPTKNIVIWNVYATTDGAVTNVVVVDLAIVPLVRTGIGVRRASHVLGVEVYNNAMLMGVAKTISMEMGVACATRVHGKRLVENRVKNVIQEHFVEKIVIFVQMVKS